MSLELLYKEEKLKRVPLKTFKVASRTNFNPDLGVFEEYTVELWSDEFIGCNCLWGQRGNKKKLCYHAKKIKEDLEKEFGFITNAVNHYKNYGISNTKRS